jgi:hypothetical protein
VKTGAFADMFIEMDANVGSLGSPGAGMDALGLT